MDKPTKPLYFVHISDTHFGTDRNFVRHGHKTWPCARDLVKRINSLPCQPDFVVHTGDVASKPVPAAYKLAADTLGELKMPIYYATGNHDTTVGIKKHLPMGSCEPLCDDENLLSYRFDRGGYRFLVIDARAPDEMDPHGLLSELQLSIIHDEVSGGGGAGELPLLLFLHFAVLPINSTWFDKNMLIVNGRKLHEELLPARDRVKGVFHGHLHFPRVTTRDGILYSSVSSSFANFSAWPGESELQGDESLPGFNFVQLLPTGEMIIHNHTIPRPVTDKVNG
ncbi:MAG: metallophosphoesterase [Bacteroidetes bacterium]|nr:metallophosphoesterase [Bacteroidota bacterium]